jgi:CRP/FNR family transcriptional regulator
MNTLKILFEKFGYRIGEKQILDLPFSKTVLANIIGIRRETLSRTITSLEQEDILKNDKNRYLLKYKI